MHIQFKNFGLSTQSQELFSSFTAQLNEGDRVAIIGRNGSGKTSLLKAILGEIEPSEGSIQHSDCVTLSYVSQLEHKNTELSGAQSFNKRLSKALSNFPNVLILDEPTNHLDADNRKSLMSMLKYFYGILIIVTHDVAFLNSIANTIWEIDSGRIHTFKGRYQDYQQEKFHKRNNLLKQIDQIDKEKKKTHLKLMKEQKRAASSKQQGQKNIDNRKWATVVSKAKTDRGNTTANKNKTALVQNQQDLKQKLKELHFIEEIRPSFELSKFSLSKGNIIAIADGQFRYRGEEKAIASNINLKFMSGERILLQGKNGSGKTSFLRALLSHPSVCSSGDWQLISPNDIGYLDQKYANLDESLTVYESLKQVQPKWIEKDIRHKLNEFLFRKNDEVFKSVGILSGGEKARLSLCLLSTLTPKLLILDEVTNNLDIETKEHVASIIEHYPGTLLVISHDAQFLERIKCNRIITIKNNAMTEG